MLVLIELIIFFLVLPYILFGIVLRKIGNAVCAFFNPVLLLASVWIASLGLVLLPSSVPSDRPYVSVVEMTAQGHIFGIQTPSAIFIVAALVLVISAIARRRKVVRKTPRQPDRGPYY